MAVQTGRLSPSAREMLKDLVINIAILETFHKLAYDCSNQNQVVVVSRFLLGNSNFVMLSILSGKLLDYTSLLYTLRVNGRLLE